MFRILASTLICSLLSFPTFSQVTLPVEAQAPVEPVLIVPPSKPLTTGMNRALSKYLGNLHFSPLSTWVPLKYGASFGSVLDEKWVAEAEVTQGSFATGLFGVDFGRVTDRRYGIQARFYPHQGSFNFIMGLFQNEISFELGSAMFNRIPGVPSTSVFKVRGIGPQLGLSNRWQWSSGFTFGVDWFQIYYPLFDKQAEDDLLKAVTNQSDKDDLNGVVKFFRDKPEFDLLKLTFGWAF